MKTGIKTAVAAASRVSLGVVGCTAVALGGYVLTDEMMVRERTEVVTVVDTVAVQDTTHVRYELVKREVERVYRDTVYYQAMHTLSAATLTRPLLTLRNAQGYRYPALEAQVNGRPCLVLFTDEFDSNVLNPDFARRGGAVEVTLDTLKWNVAQCRVGHPQLGRFLRHCTIERQVGGAFEECAGNFPEGVPPVGLVAGRPFTFDVLSSTIHGFEEIEYSPDFALNSAWGEAPAEEPIGTTL